MCGTDTTTTGPAADAPVTGPAAADPAVASPAAGPELVRLRLDLGLRRVGFPRLGLPARPADGPADRAGGARPGAGADGTAPADRRRPDRRGRACPRPGSPPRRARRRWARAAGPAARRLARLLPADVRVRAIATAPAGFDARFSALWRRYSYRVCDDPAGTDPLRRHDTLWHPRPLDLGRMNTAAAACLGEHDFAAFCRRREGATTVRALLELTWARPAPGVAVATVVPTRSATTWSDH